MNLPLWFMYGSIFQNPEDCRWNFLEGYLETLSYWFQEQPTWDDDDVIKLVIEMYYLLTYTARRKCEGFRNSSKLLFNNFSTLLLCITLSKRSNFNIYFFRELAMSSMTSQHNKYGGHWMVNMWTELLIREWVPDYTVPMVIKMKNRVAGTIKKSRRIVKEGMVVSTEDCDTCLPDDSLP